MNNVVYLVNLKDGHITEFKLTEFLHHFNHSEYLSVNYNVYLSREQAVEESEQVKADNIKKEGV